MLYDILPPLTLFLSFGGIIVLVSRVILRMRSQELSQQIHAEVAAGAPMHEESLLGPGNKGVQLVKNRLVHAAQSVRESAERVGNKVRHIEMPETNFRERMMLFTKKGTESISSFAKKVGSRIPNPFQRIAAIRQRVQAQSEDTQTPLATPVIRLVRHTEKQNIIAKIVKREKEQTPLEKAANEIANQHFDAAEDILVPYLMKHASDTKAYMLLGKTASGKGSWDEAMEIFQQVLKINNEEVDAYAQLGHAALQAGKFTVAMQSLQRARDNDPNNICIREELLFIAQRMDNKVVERSVAEELAELKKELI